MKETRFKYRGVDVVVQDDHPNGVVIVGKRKFKVSHHHAGGLPIWMCEEAYFATPDRLGLHVRQPWAHRRSWRARGSRTSGREKKHDCKNFPGRLAWDAVKT